VSYPTPLLSVTASAPLYSNKYLLLYLFINLFITQVDKVANLHFVLFFILFLYFFCFSCVGHQHGRIRW
jgi:hypothetical protein